MHLTINSNITTYNYPIKTTTNTFDTVKELFVNDPNQGLKIATMIQ